MKIPYKIWMFKIKKIKNLQQKGMIKNRYKNQIYKIY